MSRVDQLTNKKAMRGNTRSFAMNHSPRRWELNLQKATIKDGRGKRTVRVTARTLKTLKRQKKLAPIKTKPAAKPAA
ncbi:MAG: 50S ribosomal protein L28 [Mycoplasmataceae bacterium]|jgi:large subunit ribosomal protein L28|nr:50S ribosomal protein L28 [Mycoplasmataceae bacterium]